VGGMEPDRSLDKFRLREIERELAAQLQLAKEQLRRATTVEAKRTASELHGLALQRFADFAGRKIVPEEFLGD
jgi:hypothetical protein